MFYHYREIASRSHGRRDQQIQAREEKDAGWVQYFSRERHNKLQRWFSEQAKGGEKSFDSGVFQELIESLREEERL